MDLNVPPEISLSLFDVLDVTQWRKWLERVMHFSLTGLWLTLPCTCVGHLIFQISRSKVTPTTEVALYISRIVSRGKQFADSDLVDFLSGSTDSVIDFRGSADLHIPIHPLIIHSYSHEYLTIWNQEFQGVLKWGRKLPKLKGSIWEWSWPNNMTLD